MEEIEERYRNELCSTCHLENWCKEIGKRCSRLSSLVKGATEQKAIDDAHLAEVVAQWKKEEEMWIKQKEKDDERIKKLEEALKAYRAFCYNIINGVFIDNKKAAIEQLQYIKTDFSKDVDWDSLED